MKKKSTVKPEGKIEYGRLKKKTELVGLAADFYLLTAMRTIVDREDEKGATFLKSKKKLLDDVRTAHNKDTENLEKLFLAYILLAVVSELQYKDKIKTSEKKIDKVVGTFFEELSGEKPENNCLAYLKQCVPTCEDALSFFRSAKRAFGALKSGFGGKVWQSIVDKTIMRLRGEISAVVFVDIIFDIEHHGGHVFDKHDTIQCNNEQLKGILDSKRDYSLEVLYKKCVHEYGCASPRVKAFYARGVVATVWKEVKNSTAEDNT